LRVPYIETSAKARMNVHQAFTELVRLVRRFREAEGAREAEEAAAREEADGEGRRGGRRRERPKCNLL